MKLSKKWVLRPLSAIFGLCVLGAGANYYFDLGWFGSQPRFALSLTLLVSCIFLMVSQRPDVWRD